jgi:molybdopterin synthase sulfur carrier subunit
MKVNFYATLRQIVGAKTVDFSLEDGITVRFLIDEIVRQYPPLRSELLDENGNLYQHVHVFINGRDVPYLEQAMETPVSSMDTISVFPAVGGGSWG